MRVFLVSLFAIVAVTTSIVFYVGTSDVKAAPVAAAAAATAPQISVFPTPACLYGISKDLCDGLLQPNPRIIQSCDQFGCRTLSGVNETLGASVSINPDLCTGPTSPTAGHCDQIQLNGGLRLYGFNFDLKINDPCKYRGCWTSKFRIDYEDGTVVSGTASGTLGVGTHRQTCSTADPCGEDCESCQDTGFDPNTGMWNIGLEGCLNGAYLGMNCATVCMTISGDLTAAGNNIGITDIETATFRFCGALDGVARIECECVPLFNITQ